MSSAVLWCDGSCDNRFEHRHGGWAYRLVLGGLVVLEGSGAIANTSSSRMEMQAAIEGIIAAVGLGVTTLEVRSDSSYLVNCFRQKWYVKWRKNGWRSSTKGPVVNQDLWEKLLELHEKHSITWIHVKGHVGVTHNEWCDRAAMEARVKGVQS